MQERSGHILILCLLLVPTLVLAEGSTHDWPHFRGLNQDGKSLASGLFEGQAVGFEVAWQRELGSGYSSISIAGSRGVTMFTDGKDDLVTAFDITSGKELWRYRMAEMYKGHSGSDDGPISTPTIADDVVYGLGPRGQLFALRLEDGSEIWSRTLDGKKDSLTPHYGFSTVPLVDGDHLIVQTGGPDGHSITAYDRGSGAPRWSTGDEPVNYQSPAVMELAGHRQVVAINDKYLLGIESANGQVLWRHEHGTEAFEAFAQPLDLGQDRVLVNSLNEVVAFQLSTAGDGYDVKELWRSNAFKRSYAIPVAHQGYLYGFSRKFLTCIDLETGEEVWKSRPPGGEGLILVDGQLLVVSPKGELVAVAASPEGYTETARIALFENGGMTPPSFAAGHVFVRTLSRMAAVRITDAPTVAKTPDRGLLGKFGKFVQRVEASTNRASLIEDYLGQQESFPIIEDNGEDDDIVHFLYQGEVKDIAIAGNFLGWREEVALDQIVGTDLYFKSFELDPEAIWEYRFNVDFGTLAVDSLNPHQLQSLFGRMSVLYMPSARQPDDFAEPEGPRGRMDAFHFRSEIRDNERRIRVYLPAGYGDSEERYPVLVVNVAHPSLGSEIENGLDNLIVQDRMAKVLIVLVPQVQREFGGPNSADYIRLLTEELIPHLDKHYRTWAEPESRGIMGVAQGGAMAVYGALKAPGTFGKVAAQSIYLLPPFSEELLGLIETSEKPSWTAILEWQRHDVLIPNYLDAAGGTRQVFEALEGRGAKVHRREVPGAWGASSWRIGLADILTRLYPSVAEASPSHASHGASLDWFQYRGPDQNGALFGNGELNGENLGLEVAWKRQLGSGYSSISIVGERGVTMFTDGKDDLLTAFDVATGKELWRYRIAEMYKGHDGSDDGPVSTPTIVDGVVYGLGPLGQLFAVRLADGEEIWQRTLDGEKDSLTPEYGFSTVPIVEGDLLIVQTGGPDGHSVTAFDRRSGEPRWSTENDPVNYQSPIVLELAGHRQVVAINDKVLFGLEASTGEVLWRHEHGTTAIEAFTQPLDLGQNRLLISSLDEVVAVRIAAEKGSFSVSEVWRSSGFKRSYAIPVVHEGHVYGFNAAFLSCLDAATGDVAWKSRPPGGDGLILVDGKLLILAPKGDLVVVEASAEGYKETARLPVFQGSSMTTPSVAKGLILVRDLKEMAAIRVSQKTQ